MPDPVPIVLIEIDENSAVCIRQSVGVHVAFVDHRIERDVLVLMPEQDQEAEIMTTIAHMTPVSPKLGHDDWARTAVATIERIARGGVIVAKGPVR